MCPKKFLGIDFIVDHHFILGTVVPPYHVTRIFNYLLLSPTKLQASES